MRGSKTSGSRIATTVGAIVVAGLWFIRVDAGSHSASDTLRPWLVGVVVIVLVAIGTVIALERLLVARRR